GTAERRALGDLALSGAGDGRDSCSRDAEAAMTDGGFDALTMARAERDEAATAVAVARDSRRAAERDVRAAERRGGADDAAEELRAAHRRLQQAEGELRQTEETLRQARDVEAAALERAENLTRVNAADAPAKAAPADVILVVPTETAPATGDAAALRTYWRAVWLADGNAAGESAAFATLEGAVGGTARARQLVDDYRAFNLADGPTPPLEKTDVAVSVVFVVFPAGTPTTTASWTRAPRVEALPDRLVLIARAGN